MKKIIPLLLLLMAALSFQVSGQVATASIGNYTAAPGSQIDVEVNVTGFTNVAAITLFFEYDPNVVVFSGYTPHGDFESMFVSGSEFDGKYKVGMNWAPGTEESLPDGTLFSIHFTYLGGTCNFTFDQSNCEIVRIVDNDLVIMPVIYTNGSVSPVGDATVTIEDQLNIDPNQLVPPGNLPVPLVVDFADITEGVGAFTFVVLYDEAKLVFQNTSDEALAGINIYNFSDPSRLVFMWENPDVLSSGSKLSGTLLNMNFSFTGGNTQLVFDEANCALSDNLANEISAIYEPGEVTQDPQSLTTISLPNLQKDPGTLNVVFPVSVTNFTNIAAFELHISYDPAVMSFVGLANLMEPLAESQFQVNDLAGAIGISWIGPAITVPAGALFDMVFDYTSGSTGLTFNESLSELTNNDLNEVPAVYSSGSISEHVVYDATATIPHLLATMGQSVEVPVYATGFTNIGAINFNIGFDNTVMTFSAITGVNDFLASNGTYSVNNVDGQLYFEWMINPELEYEDSPVIPDNVPLFSMRFTFNGGTSPLAFNEANCAVSLADDDITSILVTYNDGSVYGGIVSLTESTITANPVAMEVGETSTVTVQLKDQLGNLLPASGGAVELFTTLGTLGAVTDNNDGTYTAQMTSATSGVATITGKLNGQDFTDDATVFIHYILTLEINGNGKVKLGDIEYDQPSQQISVTTPTATLEAIPGTGWQIYSWTAQGVTASPLGEASYEVTMNSDKTVVATFHLPGDANCDGQITISDATTMVSFINSLNPAIFCFKNADVNRDGNISVIDITLIVNTILNP